MGEDVNRGEARQDEQDPKDCSGKGYTQIFFQELKQNQSYSYSSAPGAYPKGPHFQRVIIIDRRMVGK